ncbi:hypothetical protein D3C71_24690 [compost metagenome]
MSLGTKQRLPLNLVADACVPHEMKPNGPKQVIPHCTGRLASLFESVAEQRRLLENLESQGSVRVENGRFGHIPPEGLKAIEREPLDPVKTSTLTEAAEARWERTGHTVITVEDPVEIRLPRPAERKDGSGAGVDGVDSARFEERVRQLMREEPRTLWIGRPRENVPEAG